MPCWLFASLTLALGPGPTPVVLPGSGAPPPAPAPDFIADWMIWVVTILLGIIGFALAWRGLIGDRARGRPCCFKCRYDMSGGTRESLACPECGHVHKDRRKLFKTRRYYKQFAFGSVLLMASLYCHTAPDVQFRRSTLGEKWWESIVPTWVWIVMLPELEEERVYFLNERLHPPEPVQISSAPTTFFTSGDMEELDFGSDQIKVLMTWEAKLLLSSARRRLETLPNVGGVRTSFARQLVIEWIYSVRPQVDITDEVIWLLQNEKGQHERVRAAYELGVASRTDLAVPALIEALNYSDDDIQQMACLALEKIGPPGRAALPALLEVLDDAQDSRSSHTIRLAIRAVESIGGANASQMTRLLQRNFIVRDWVYENGILWTVLPDDVTSRDAARGLITTLNSESTAARQWAHNVFQSGGERMLPLLAWAVNQPDIPLDEGLSDHIQNLGPKAAPMSPGIVVKMLRDPNRYRLMLPSMLSFAGDPSRETLTLLVEGLNHDDPVARQMVQDAIDVIAPKPETMLPVLLERLKSKDASHRVSAILQMANVGPPAIEAVPRLRELMAKDESPEVREAAAALVKMFEP